MLAWVRAKHIACLTAAESLTALANDSRMQCFALCHELAYTSRQDSIVSIVQTAWSLYAQHGMLTCQR